MTPEELRKILLLPAEKLRETVLAANKALHKDFGDMYDASHPQLLHSRYQQHLFNDLCEACAFIGRDKPLREATVCDLGSGTGLLPARLLGIAPVKLTCVDLSDTMLARLREKIYIQHGVNIQTITQEITEYCRQQTETYDMITMSAILHHVFNVEEVICAAVERVKQRGVIYIAFEPLKNARMDPSIYRMHCILREIDELLRERRVLEKSEKYDDLTIADFHTVQGGIDPEAIMNVLQEKGFTVRADPFYVRHNENLAWFGDAVLEAKNTFSIIAKRDLLR